MNDSVYIIAEAGVNHNGDLGRAREMIFIAAETGADAIKFQTFLPDALCCRNAGKAAYQIRNDGTQDSQLEMLRRVALDFDAHHELVEHCQQCEIDFLSSPCDTRSANFLINELKLSRLILESGELTNGPLLFQVGKSGCELILSTGMAELIEIEEALGLLSLAMTRVERPGAGPYTDHYKKGVMDGRLELMHCTTEFPCPPERVNLRAMETIAHTFGLPVGYSDHTMGIEVSLAAAARGARLLEKHFTLDRSAAGPDNAVSLEPNELQALVSGVRVIEQALGSAVKKPGSVERENAAVMRKSLVAADPIREGQLFTGSNLTAKRPASGRSPMDYWDILGTRATRDYAVDEVVSCDSRRQGDLGEQSPAFIEKAI